MNNKQIEQSLMVEYEKWIMSDDPTSPPLHLFVRQVAKKAAEMARKDEQKSWLDVCGKGEFVITMKVRDLDDETEAIRHVFTFDQIGVSNRKLFQLTFEEMLGKIITAPILKKVIELWQ